jgi:hypothetical protein
LRCPHPIRSGSNLGSDSFLWGAFANHVQSEKLIHFIGRQAAVFSMPLPTNSATDPDFVRAGQAVNLTAPGRKRFFQMYEQRMSSLITHPLFDYKVSYRRALELQARLLAKTLTGEIAEYIPLLTR